MVSILICCLIIYIFASICLSDNHMEYLTDEHQPSHSKKKINKKAVTRPWHTAGGALYFTKSRSPTSIHQDIMDGQASVVNTTSYVSDVLAGNDGTVPIIEPFWYDINRLEDTAILTNTLDNDYNKMIKKEKRFYEDAALSREKRNRGIITRKNMTELKKLSSPKNKKTKTKESFGNRSPYYWNEKEYPIVTTNNVNMNSIFPQISH